jgi:hypothetical protein
MMRFCDQQHQYYCGVDLHARSMYLHILDADKRTLLDEDLPADPAAFLDAVAPYREGLVVGAECMFAWYWLADLCEDESIPFTLGHALYMKAIHGGKTKTDKIDAGKIAGLLRGGMFPMAHVYPRAMRETRDLLRRRTFFVRQKAQLIAHITNTNSQYNLPPFERKLSRHPDYSDLAGFVFTPKGLYSTAQGREALRAHPGNHRTHSAFTPKGLYKFGTGALYNPFGVKPSGTADTQGGAALTLGCGIQPLRGKDRRRKPKPKTASNRRREGGSSGLGSKVSEFVDATNYPQPMRILNEPMLKS